MGDATAKAAEDHMIRTKKGSLLKKLLYNTAETKRFDGDHTQSGQEEEGKEEEEERDDDDDDFDYGDDGEEEEEEEETKQEVDIYCSRNESTIPLHLQAPLLWLDRRGGFATITQLDNINWLRSSRLLRNVGVVYTTPNNSPNPDETIIIGMDPGEVNSMTATRIGPSERSRTSTSPAAGAPASSTSTSASRASAGALASTVGAPVRPDSAARASVVVRRSFLYKPYTMFRGLLQQRKADQGIDIIETKIPSMTMEGIRRYLDYFKNGVRDKLFDFYLSPWYLRKSWDMRKAQLAAYDYGIKAIMRLAGKKTVNEGRRKVANDGNVVFAIGLGSFNTQTGLPSKHGELEKRFITRVKSLGYDVVGVHEYYTSAKCPRHGCNAFLEQVKKTRSKYCRNCKAFMDRDKVGSENIATICRAHMQNQARPDKYRPPANH
ncbi:hypothetical protein BGX28_000134 [Mortierella sp. GBA30]|nr:hypothetical protein BGX28_000134 [Mortierella sp. GBA30]